MRKIYFCRCSGNGFHRFLYRCQGNCSVQAHGITSISAEQVLPFPKPGFYCGYRHVPVRNRRILCW